MGNPNLMQEEVRAMRKRSERSLVFFAVIFVFACLLFSGGSRLIGHEGEESVPVQSVSAAAAQFCAMPAPDAPVGHTPVLGIALRRELSQTHQQGDQPRALVCSDANGNVLGSASYLHAVYQAFSLGDGFV